MTKPYTDDTDMLSAGAHGQPVDWLARLQELVMRFDSLGLGGDIASLSIIELWAVYRFLMRVAGE